MSRWMYAVAWKNENGKTRQKEFRLRSDAEALVEQLKVKEQPYTFSRFCKMTLLDRWYLSQFRWGPVNFPARWIVIFGLVLAAPVALSLRFH